MARTLITDQDEIDAERAPEGLGNGLIIVTTLLLLGAFIVIELALKHHFGAGMFAK